MVASIDARAVTILTATTAAASYLIAKCHFERKAVTERQKQYKADQKASLAQKERRKKEGSPSGTKLEELGSDGVYLWDVERLGNYFPSEGEGIENVMSALRGAAISADHAAYNKLIGERECILANIRRKPGTAHRTSAYLRA